MFSSPITNKACFTLFFYFLKLIKINVKSTYKIGMKKLYGQLSFCTKDPRPIDDICATIVIFQKTSKIEAKSLFNKMANRNSSMTP